MSGGWPGTATGTDTPGDMRPIQSKKKSVAAFLFLSTNFHQSYLLHFHSMDRKLNRWFGIRFGAMGCMVNDACRSLSPMNRMRNVNGMDAVAQHRQQVQWVRVTYGIGMATVALNRVVVSSFRCHRFHYPAQCQCSVTKASIRSTDVKRTTLTSSDYWKNCFFFLGLDKDGYWLTGNKITYKNQSLTLMDESLSTWNSLCCRNSN